MLLDLPNPVLYLVFIKIKNTERHNLALTCRKLMNFYISYIIRIKQLSIIEKVRIILKYDIHSCSECRREDISIYSYLPFGKWVYVGCEKCNKIHCKECALYCSGPRTSKKHENKKHENKKHENKKIIDLLYYYFDEYDSLYALIFTCKQFMNYRSAKVIELGIIKIIKNTYFDVCEICNKKEISPSYSEYSDCFYCNRIMCKNCQYYAILQNCVERCTCKECAIIKGLPLGLPLTGVSTNEFYIKACDWEDNL